MQLTGGKNDLSDMVKQLSDMLAYSLADAKVPATLGAEFAHARRYAELQRRRFGDRFSCECVEDPELSAVPCIKLILQPLVENAFEHGFSDKERGGMIRVSASRDQDSGRLQLVVEDDGIGMAEERLKELQALIAAGAESPEHVGLVNTARRLSLAYGVKAGCAVESWPGHGTKITLLFPDLIPAAIYPGSPAADSFD
jgi:two-component system sensor histidine kinase YesM